MRDDRDHEPPPELADTPEPTDPHALADAPDEPPPLGTWPRMYAVVLGSLALWVTLFYFFTRAFE